MLLAFLLAASVTNWAPARWSSADPQSIPLIKETPVNCVLQEEVSWSEAFAVKAEQEGVATLGVIRPGGDAAASAQRAIECGLTGVVLEGQFEEAILRRLRRTLAKSKLVVIALPPRTGIRLDSKDAVIGSCQGAWAGINTLDDGSAKAAPTGAPWIDTNSGFLRFVRASTEATVWIGNLPPPNTVIPIARYLQAIGDAAMVGARWVVALDDDFSKRLLGGDQHARQDWKRIGEHMQFWEQHRQWAGYKPYRGLAVIQDIDSGGLLNGGVLDMLGPRHVPIRAMPIPKLSDETMESARMAMSVDPASLSTAQKEILRRFTRTGASLLSAPPGWKFPPMRPGQIALDESEIETLDQIWRGLNSMMGRQNLGVRLFNVSSVLCELVAGPGGRPVVLHLVNYSDYPVDLVTAHFVDRFQRARLYTPGAPVTELEVYEEGAGSGVDLEGLAAFATLVLE